MGRERKYTEREVKLAKLWHKLARTAYAIVDYDMYINKYSPKLTTSEVNKLKAAYTAGINEALKKSKKYL